MTLMPNRFAIMVMLTVFLGACVSAPTAVTDHDSRYDFSGVQKIAILPLNRQVIPSAMLSDMQAARVSDSLGSELVRRGYTIVEDPQNADLWMTWHLVTQERVQVRSYNTMSAHYSSCWHCPTSGGTNVRMQQYTQGTVIVDLIDPERQVSVWRSIIEKPRTSKGEEQLSQSREGRARALFAEFPPL